MQYGARLRTLIRSAGRAHLLFGQKAISQADAALLYEAAFLAAVSSFEAMIEDLFVGLLVGELQSSDRGVQPRAAFRSHATAREFILAGRPYADWLPYERTQERAKVFFRGGRPFTGLATSEITHLARCLAIRNAIAHKSRHASRQFERQVTAGLSLAPRDKSPAGFLMSQHSAYPPQSRFENMLADLHRVAVGLCR